MAMRLQVRAGEVAAILGMDSSLSPWKLYTQMRDATESQIQDYGRWQARLAVPIANGICVDHRLKNKGAVDYKDAAQSHIIPSRGWKVASKDLTGGRESILIVTQRTGPSLREWNEPDTMPAKSRVRYEAIATAYDIEDILVGMLVDGYGTRLFHVRTPKERREELLQIVKSFIDDVKSGEEPELDFGADEADIRRGDAVSKVIASAEVVDGLIQERDDLIKERTPLENRAKQINARLRDIDTNLIHMAGSSLKLETPMAVVTINRDAKGVAKVDVTTKKTEPLF